MKERKHKEVCLAHSQAEVAIWRIFWNTNHKIWRLAMSSVIFSRV